MGIEKHNIGDQYTNEHRSAAKKAVQHFKLVLNICGMSDADDYAESSQNTNGGESILSAIIIYWLRRRWYHHHQCKRSKYDNSLDMLRRAVLRR